MKISEVIERLKELQGIAGDVEVVSVPSGCSFFEPAKIEIESVIQHRPGVWRLKKAANSKQVVTVS